MALSHDWELAITERSPSHLFYSNEGNTKPNTGNSSTNDLYDPTMYQYNTSEIYDCPMFNGNVTYLNISCESNIEVSIWIYGFFTPFFIIITLVANILIVVVLSQKKMLSPTNSVLKAMALCDLMTVICPAPGILYMYTFGNHYKPLSPTLMCYLYNVFNEALPAVFHTASIWLTLALAGQRYIYVRFYQYAHLWCTKTSTSHCIAGILFVSALHQTTRFFDKSYTLVTTNWEGHPTEVCHMATAPWVHEYLGENLYYTIFYGFRVIGVHLIPCTALVVLNILLYIALKKAQRQHERILCESKKKESRKTREDKCTTLMLIVVVTVFLLVEIPLAVITAMHIISSAIYEFLDYEKANLCILIANFSIVVSYPINFGIYCGMSRNFRETFKALFLSGSVSGRMRSNTSQYSCVNGPRTIQTNETIL